VTISYNDSVGYIYGNTKLGALDNIAYYPH
jgi:hypothetical protein